MEKDHTEYGQPTKKFGSVVTILAVFTVLLGLYGAFMQYRASSIDGELALVNEVVAAEELKVQEFEKLQVEDVLNAQKAVESINQVNVKWSEVLRLLLDATPDDIVYRSYSGNDNGTISMTVMASSFNRVADLIDILESKSFIKRAFVPSVVKGTTPTNAAVYSFSLNIEYEK